MDVGQLRVPEEPADDSGTLLEALQSIDRDCLELVSGQRHGPRDPVVLDVLVDPFVGVQLGRIGRKEEQLQSSLRAGDVVLEVYAKPIYLSSHGLGRDHSSESWRHAT